MTPTKDCRTRNLGPGFIHRDCIVGVDAVFVSKVFLFELVDFVPCSSVNFLCLFFEWFNGGLTTCCFKAITKTAPSSSGDLVGHCTDGDPEA